MRHGKSGVQGLYGTAPGQLQNWHWQDPQAALPADPPQGTQGGGTQLEVKVWSKKGHPTLQLCQIAKLKANVDIRVGHRRSQLFLCSNRRFA